MLSQWIRIFYSDNGTLTDYSLEAQNDDLIPSPLVTSEDYIYVAQYLPFNNLFFDLNTANTVSANIRVEYWEGSTWKTAVDVIDATKSSGISFAKDGVVQFSPDRDFPAWERVTDTSDKGAPPELETIDLYHMYWCRLSFSATLDVATALDKIGYRFATDEQLLAIEPEVNKYLNAWESGKITWSEQLQLASQHLVYDLKARGLILGPGQIIRFDDVSLATAYRCLMHIYSILGKGFETKMMWAKEEYEGLLRNKRFTFDKDMDGSVDRNEIYNSVRKLIR